VNIPTFKVFWSDSATESWSNNYEADTLTTEPRAGQDSNRPRPIGNRTGVIYIKKLGPTYQLRLTSLVLDKFDSSELDISLIIYFTGLYIASLRSELVNNKLAYRY